MAKTSPPATLNYPRPVAPCHGSDHGGKPPWPLLAGEDHRFRFSQSVILFAAMRPNEPLALHLLPASPVRQRAGPDHWQAVGALRQEERFSAAWHVSSGGNRATPEA